MAMLSVIRYLLTIVQFRWFLLYSLGHETVLVLALAAGVPFVMDPLPFR